MSKPLNHSQDHASIVSGYLRQQLRSLAEADKSIREARAKLEDFRQSRNASGWGWVFDEANCDNLMVEFPGEHGQGQF